MEPLLQAEHLSISFTQYDRGTRRLSLPVIRDLTFAIRPGQVTAVVGSSGSGKSLLAHGILGILPYNASLEGTIAYGGEPLTRRRVEAFRGREITLVPQGVTYLDPLMEIGPQIRRGRRDDRARAESRAVLARYGLGAEAEGMYPFELSGGMNQRAGIAIAMLMNPAVLLADEPTSALDMAVQRQVVEEMLHVREAFGTAIIIVTHDIGVVSAMADSIVVLSNGRVMEYAAAKDVLENPQNDYTVKLLSAVPRLRREKA